MLDLVKIGKQLALLRKEKGFTGEKLAELLNVSPQAVSKWENGKCLPETALLPDIAKVLDCSIDTLILPKELVILEAVYTDGITSVNIVQTINNYVHDNKLSIYVNGQFIGVTLDSDRLKLLTVKYQTPKGIYYTYALQNELLSIDTTPKDTNDKSYKLIGAFYGNAKEYISAMQKMEHYEYFKWDEIHVNHETFPSNPASDDTEYLTLVYLNKSGIHVISCQENDTLYYIDNRTNLSLRDNSKCILPGIDRLEWEKGMECPWAGSLYVALKYMGENYTYDQIMGMSGACYRICFVDVWDWSCTDALVAFDYATPLYNAIGYTPVWANRLEKGDRKAERLAIMNDLKIGKPILAINLRLAPEWGVITGYLENGNKFLCRTYFDKEIFDNWEKNDYQDSEDKRLTFDERDGYLINDFWPFLITHFGDKIDKPSPVNILMTSLTTLITSWNADRCGGYYQGKQAYEAWICGLSDDSAFDIVGDKDNVYRRLGVNESMLFNLIDARRSAEKYLRDSVDLLPEDKSTLLIKIADHYRIIYEDISAFRDKVKFCYDTETFDNPLRVAGVATHELRLEQIRLLKKVVELEEENTILAEIIIKN
jgi:transcriptional regulator with XRE-family HTH domain